jgi:glycosyltransferase involved in cell wall biosynthesis
VTVNDGAPATLARGQAPPRVTVLLCVYNGERYLDEALHSIRNQTLRDLEILVIDDGSTDGTAAILQRHAAEDQRIRVERHDHNRGLVASRNWGLGIAQARYVALMDADDVALPQRLERQLQFLELHPDVPALGTWAWHIGPRGRRVSASDVGPATSEAFQRMRKDARVFFLIAPTVMLDRVVVLDAGGFREAMFPAEDADLWTRLAAQHEVLALPERLLLYRVHGGSISSTRFREQMEQIALLEENVRRRARGDDELEPATFRRLLRASPWWWRLDWQRTWRARYWYRVAGGLLADGRPGGLFWLGLSLVLAPRVATSRLQRQVTPRLRAASRVSIRTGTDASGRKP